MRIAMPARMTDVSESRPIPDSQEVRAPATDVCVPARSHVAMDLGPAPCAGLRRRELRPEPPHRHTSEPGAGRRGNLLDPAGSTQLQPGAARRIPPPPPPPSRAPRSTLTSPMPRAPSSFSRTSARTTPPRSRALTRWTRSEAPRRPACQPQRTVRCWPANRWSQRAGRGSQRSTRCRRVGGGRIGRDRWTGAPAQQPAGHPQLWQCSRVTGSCARAYTCPPNSPDRMC